MKSAIYPMTAQTPAVADRWKRAALSCDPADHARAAAAARLAYQAAGQPEPSRFLWCPSPPSAVEQLRRLLEDGHTSLVTSVRRDNLNRSLAVARAPIWEQTSELDRFSAFGDFHHFMEWTGYYGEQRYDGVEARYDLMEHPYRCKPVTEPEHRTLEPVLHTVRRVYDLAHGPIWETIDGNLTASYTMQPAWFWGAESSIVDQDDEGHAVVRYCLNPRYWLFEPAWNYYPDMSERPTVLRINAQGWLHAEDEPAAVWPDGSLMWTRDAKPLPPP